MADPTAPRLVVRGAREHNLRGVDLDLPRDSMIVFTGLSGSGKSSLAFDTIFAEGQRRYVESLSRLRPAVPRADGQARRRLHRGPVPGRLDRPEVDQPQPALHRRHHHRGLRLPAAALRPGRHPALPDLRPRDRASRPRSRSSTRCSAMEEGSRFQVLAPVVRTRKGEFVDLFATLQAQGYSRVRVDGAVHPLTDPPKLKKQEKHDIAVVVDRLAVKGSAKQRLTDSVETALRLADGLVVLDFVDLPDDDPHRERRFSERMACPNGHPLSLDDLEPRSFSFNSPYGACPECTGIGTKQGGRPRAGGARPGAASLAGGAIAPWAGGQTAEYFGRLLEGLADTVGFRMDTPWRKLPAGRAEGRAARHRRAGARPLPQPVRPRALVLRQLRGRHPVPRAAARRRPSPTTRARSTRATCGRCRARRARAPGSSPRSWPSRWCTRDAGRQVDRRGLGACPSPSARSSSTGMQLGRRGRP